MIKTETPLLSSGQWAGPQVQSEEEELLSSMKRNRKPVFKSLSQITDRLGCHTDGSRLYPKYEAKGRLLACQMSLSLCWVLTRRQWRVYTGIMKCFWSQHYFFSVHWDISSQKNKVLSVHYSSSGILGNARTMIIFLIFVK